MHEYTKPTPGDEVERSLIERIHPVYFSPFRQQCPHELELSALRDKVKRRTACSRSCMCVRVRHACVRASVCMHVCMNFFGTHEDRHTHTL